MPKLIVFASGTKEGGGSGFENLVNAAKRGEMHAEIVAVVSNHAHGGVAERAARLGVPFIHFDPERRTYFFKDQERSGSYADIVRESGAEWVALSGWLKKVEGLDPKRTFNIHPALLSVLDGQFGGSGMYGHRVHEAVADALKKGEIAESGVTMHFVTDAYDRGPIFFEYHVPLLPGDDAAAIGKKVNEAEHAWQPKITDLVLRGDIAWDGSDPKTIQGFRSIKSA